MVDCPLVLIGNPRQLGIFSTGVGLYLPARTAGGDALKAGRMSTLDREPWGGTSRYDFKD